MTPEIQALIDKIPANSSDYTNYYDNDGEYKFVSSLTDEKHMLSTLKYLMEYIAEKGIKSQLPSIGEIIDNEYKIFKANQDINPISTHGQRQCMLKSQCVHIWLHLSNLL